MRVADLFFYKISKSNAVQSLTVNLVRAFLAFSLVKFTALYGGPSSIASLSNYQNIVGLLAIFLTLSMQTGLTVLSAKDKVSRQPLILCLRVAVVLTPFILMVCYLFSSKMVLLNDFLSSDEYFFYLSLIVIPFSINIFLVAFEIGHQRYSNIFVSYLFVGGLPLLYFIAVRGDFSLQNLYFFMAFGNWMGVVFLLYKIKFKASSVLPLAFDLKQLKPLFQYGLMSGALGIIATLIAMITRFYLSSQLGSDVAGQWDALYKISILFQLVIAAPILSTSLPRMASVIDGKLSKIVFFLKSRLKIIFFMAVVSVIASVLLAEEIVFVLYSSEFFIISNIVVLIIIMESFKALAGVFLLVPLASKGFTFIVFNNLLFMINVWGGLHLLSIKSLLSLSNVAWLYVFSSFVYSLAVFIWFIFWLKNRSKLN